MFRMTRTCLFGFSEWQRITENPCSGYSGHENSTGQGSVAQRPAVIVSLPGLATQRLGFTAQVCPCHMGDTGQTTISLTSLPVHKEVLYLYQYFISAFKPLTMTHSVLKTMYWVTTNI